MSVALPWNSTNTHEDHILRIFFTTWDLLSHSTVCVYLCVPSHNIVIFTRRHLAHPLVSVLILHPSYLLRIRDEIQALW